MVSAGQVEIYATFNGDIDVYQRRGSPQSAIVGDAWSTIEDLRRRLFLVAVGHASVQFARSTEADLLAWTPNDYADLFSAGSTSAETPARSGYYVGYRVAERLSETRSLMQLAHLRGPELKHAVLGTLAELKKPA